MFNPIIPQAAMNNNVFIKKASPFGVENFIEILGYSLFRYFHTSAHVASELITLLRFTPLCGSRPV